MFLVRVWLVAFMLSVVSGFAQSSTIVEEISLAESIVKEYRALRRACTITTGDQRKECFSQLHAATSGYKEAKKVLASSDVLSEFPLVGHVK